MVFWFKLQYSKMASVFISWVLSEVYWFDQFEVIIMTSLRKFIICIANRNFSIMFDAMFDIV